MAADTDLDLAIAVALAEVSDGSSDDDFKPSSRQLELCQQNLLEKCRNYQSTKSTSNPRKRRKKTQPFPDAAGTIQRTADNRRLEQAPKDYKRRTDKNKQSKISIEETGKRATSHALAQASKQSSHCTIGKKQENLFDIFRHQVQHVACRETPQSANELEEHTSTEEPHQNSDLASNQIKNSLLGTYKNFRVIDLPETCQPRLYDSDIGKKHVSAGNDSELGHVATTFKVGNRMEPIVRLDDDHTENDDVSSDDEDRKEHVSATFNVGDSMEEIVGLDDDRTANDDASGRDEDNKEHGNTEIDGIKEVIGLDDDRGDNYNVPAHDEEDKQQVSTTIDLDFRSDGVVGVDNESQFSALLRLCDDDASDDISCLMTQQCSPASPKIKPSCKDNFVPLQDIVNIPGRSDIFRNWPKVGPGSNFLDAEIDKPDYLCNSKVSQVSTTKSPSLSLQKEGKAGSSTVGKYAIDTRLVLPGEMIKSSTNGDDQEVHHETSEGFQTVYPERTSGDMDGVNVAITCPICEQRLNELPLEIREAHTNTCLDKSDDLKFSGDHQAYPKDQVGEEPDRILLGCDPSISFGCEKVKQWLESINLSRYLDSFNQHEIDWDTLQWLTDEDLLVIGVAALGPRRKILGALQDLKSGATGRRLDHVETPAQRLEDSSLKNDSSTLITKFFPIAEGSRRLQKCVTNMVKGNTVGSKTTGNASRIAPRRPRVSVRPNIRGVPTWMCIPGTPFRVDAFQHLSGDCSHWFLTHFHTDHYQGLTRAFRYGRIFCSAITARLVNVRIGVSWDRLMIVPLNEKFNICGVDVTFIDANHCPGSVMILFEPPNAEKVLHTGDFRFCSAMADNAVLQSTSINTLILDTTYCDPQYDFPKQESVIQFVIEAIQAEAFNRETLFLIGTYTIGKERIFLEVGKVLQKKIYVGAAKMKLLECMDLSFEDKQWLTCTEHESFIHVVPLWSISSFKRMNSISRHYHGRYKLIVAFSPTGWSFGRGKKKTPGKRHQQGTMIRYEVPYSEHSSFCELQEFVKYIAPADIIPSVPGKSGTGPDEMIASLWNEGS